LCRWLTGLRFRIRPGPHTTLADQTAGYESCPRRYTNVSALANRTAEIRAAQGQTPPVFCTRCVQQSVRILMLPYFFLCCFAAIRRAARLAVLPKGVKNRWFCLSAGRLFANGEISTDGSWRHHGSDEDEDECQVVNAFDYFHCVSFSQV
jgi:hypothetical protein